MVSPRKRPKMSIVAGWRVATELSSALDSSTINRLGLTRQHDVSSVCPNVSSESDREGRGEVDEGDWTPHSIPSLDRPGHLMLL